MHYRSVRVVPVFLTVVTSIHRYGMLRELWQLNLVGSEFGLFASKSDYSCFKSKYKICHLNKLVRRDFLKMKGKEKTSVFHNQIF